MSPVQMKTRWLLQTVGTHCCRWLGPAEVGGWGPWHGGGFWWGQAPGCEGRAGTGGMGASASYAACVSPETDGSPGQLPLPSSSTPCRRTPARVVTRHTLDPTCECDVRHPSPSPEACRQSCPTSHQSFCIHRIEDEQDMIQHVEAMFVNGMHPATTDQQQSMS